MAIKQHDKKRTIPWQGIMTFIQGMPDQAGTLPTMHEQIFSSSIIAKLELIVTHLNLLNTYSDGVRISHRSFQSISAPIQFFITSIKLVFISLAKVANFQSDRSVSVIASRGGFLLPPLLGLSGKLSCHLCSSIFWPKATKSAAMAAVWVNKKELQDQHRALSEGTL